MCARVQTTIAPGYMRLHVSPFTPALLPTIVPAALLSAATNISYHTLQAYPERAFGYIDLPVEMAEKVKKRMHGSILKGHKVRVETARPAKDIVPEGPVINEALPPSLPSKREGKKRKQRPGDTVIEGLEIGDRSVKRGWTVPATEVAKRKEKRRKVTHEDGDKDKKSTKQAKPINKSKYTTEPECLFKTVLPATKAADEQITKGLKIKKNKRGKGKGKETMVHEFRQTTKYATFLRDTSTSGRGTAGTTFDEEKGWVDEGGNVVDALGVTQSARISKANESGKRASRSKGNTSTQPLEKESTKPPFVKESSISALKENSMALSNDIPDSDTSSSGSSSEDQDGEQTSSDTDDGTSTAEDTSSEEDDSKESDQNDTVEVHPTSKSGNAHTSDDDDTSSSDASSSHSSSRKTKLARPVIKTSKIDVPKVLTIQVESPGSRRPGSSGPPTGLSIAIPDSNLLKPVHPLEALYKKPKITKDDGILAGPETVASFNFFEPDDDAQSSHLEIQPPATPFTEQDMLWRRSRSAAPTPDTAFVNKRFEWPTTKASDDEDMATSSPSRPAPDKESGSTATESDFSKWFYEHRGEATRAWKKRRREAGKEKRQRENRKRNDGRV